MELPLSMLTLLSSGTFLPLANVVFITDTSKKCSLDSKQTASPYKPTQPTIAVQLTRAIRSKLLDK